MRTSEDIAALLADAKEQIAAAQQLHDDALTDKNARSRFQAKVKSILEHQRSALDYLAVGITDRYGTPKGMIYYPLAQTAAEFPSAMDAKMPGVAASMPAIATAIKKCQPYEHEWLRELNQLTREHKHNRLSLQIVRGTYRCRVTEDAAGAYVEWHGMVFAQGVIESQGGEINFQPGPNRDPAAPDLLEFAGPTGFLVFGVPIDLATQRPHLDARLTVDSQRMDRWFFIKPPQPVLFTLGCYQSGIRYIVDEVAHVGL